MRNVSELIGIVKGISFDEIINDSEVSRIKAWLEVNRALAGNSSEKKLVALIESVLEDNIITEEEKNSILQFANSINNSESAEVNTLYELEGIIDGVICDDVLNEDEIRKLQSWLNNRPVVLEDDNISNEIADTIDRILEDNIVTNDEQKELLNLLQEKLQEISYNAKILELKRMVNEKQNIGLKILDILDNRKAISSINNTAIRELARAVGSYGIDANKDYSILFISLCLIALRHYDGNFYEHVRLAYKPLYDRYSEQKIEGMIRTILDKYQLHVDANGETRLINSVLYNTIVPRMFLESFFEFIFDIYKLNFDYSIPEDIEEEFDFVYDGLRKEMLSNDDSLKVNVTKKSYKLIQTTKRLILNEKYKDIVISFSAMILSLVDHRIMNGEEEYIQNPYIAYGYKEWLSTLDTSENGRKRRSTDTTESRRVARFELDDSSVLLRTPVYHIRSDVDYSKVSIVINNGDKTICLNDCPEIREIIGGYEVTSERVPIDYPLGELQCVLMCADEELKTTGSSLYRDVLVFNESGKEIRNNTDYDGTAVVCAPPGCGIGEGSYYNADGYSLYAIMVDEGYVIHVNDSIFAFSSYIKPGVLGDLIPYQYLKEDDTDQLIPVYSKIDYLMFESAAEAEKINIVINNHTYGLQELKYTSKGHVNSKIYSVSLDFDHSDLYTVEVIESDEYSSTQICKAIFAFDKYCNVEKTRISDTRYLVNIETDLLQNKSSYEFEISEYENDWLKLMNRGKRYSYIIPVALDLFRISGHVWRSFDDGLWIEDIENESVLELLAYDADGVSVRSDKGEVLNDYIPLKDCQTHKEMNIGFLKSYKSENDYICLWLLHAGKAVGVLYCYNKCIMDMDNTDVSFDNMSGVLNVSPVFFGRGKVRLVVTDLSGEEKCRLDDVVSGDKIQVEDLKSFEEYVITLYEMVKDFAFYRKQKLHSWNRMLYAIKDFKGRFFRIGRVVYDDYRGTNYVQREYRFPNTYVHLVERMADDKFQANIVIRIKNKYYRLKEINPVDVELCSGVINGEMELIITNEGDGLLMDFEHHGILQSLDGDAPDIYSYYIDVNGVRR